MDTKKYVQLVKRVFNTEDGIKLLKYMRENVKEVYNDKPNVVYYNLGKFDLIQQLLDITKISDFEVERLTLRKNREDEFDE